MSDILDNDKLQKILEAAEKVPHGPWKFVPIIRNGYGRPEDDIQGGDILDANGNEIANEGSADGEYGESISQELLAYLALLDRDTVTAMVKRIQELEKEE